MFFIIEQSGDVLLLPIRDAQLHVVRDTRYVTQKTVVQSLLELRIMQ